MGIAEYDLVVVGSGGAAMSAAITARRAERSVLLIEARTLGGTCVNVGCVPSKALLRIAGHRGAAAADPFAGAPTSAGPVDLAALITQKDDLIAHLRQDKYTAVDDAYNDQDPAVVASELSAAAETLAAAFDAVEGPAWDRRGSRSDGAEFTVDTFGRYMIHDPVHHLHDVATDLQS